MRAERLDIGPIRHTIKSFDPGGYATVIGTAGVALHLFEDGDSSYVDWPTSLGAPEAVHAIADSWSIQLIANIGRRSKEARDTFEHHPDSQPDPTQAWHPSHPSSWVVVRPKKRKDLLQFRATTNLRSIGYIGCVLSPSVAEEESVQVAGARTLPVRTLLTHMALTHPLGEATGVEDLVELVRERNEPTLSPSDREAIRAIFDLRREALNLAIYGRSY